LIFKNNEINISNKDLTNHLRISEIIKSNSKNIDYKLNKEIV